MNKRLVYGSIGLVVLVLIVALAISLAGQSSANPGGTVDAAAEYGTVTVTGPALPPLPTDTSAADPAVGMIAPTLSGQDWSGHTTTIGPDGTPKVVLFLAHWCPHCQREVPVVQQWIDQGGGNPKVELISVATSIDPTQPNFPPSAWLARDGWTAPVIADDRNDTAAQAYGLPAFPYWVVLDGNNKVLARTTGELDTNTIGTIFNLAAQSAG